MCIYARVTAVARAADTHTPPTMMTVSELTAGLQPVPRPHNTYALTVVKHHLDRNVHICIYYANTSKKNY